MRPDQVIEDIAATAADYWRNDRETYIAVRDQWAERLFFKLGPEGCMASIQSSLDLLGMPWNEDVEAAYKKLKTLPLARNALFGLVLNELPRKARGMVSA